MTSLDTGAGREIAVRGTASRAEGPGFGRVLALAFREMRGGIRGFQVFIACVALGVMVITAVTALSDALTHGLERQGELILGGDATLARSHARASESEIQWLAARGRLSETATMRTMARSLDGEEQALAELKGVDAAYPLVGSVVLDGGASFPDAIRSEGGVRRAAVDPILLERFGIKIGGKFRVGELELVASAAIVSEPDGISDRMTFGPRIFVDLPTLEATGLVKPGSLVRWRYSLQLDEPGVASTAQSHEDRASVASFATAVKRDLPEAGFTVLDKRDPSPRVRKTLERLRQFLTLIGLTALLVGGVGVANAVQTFVDRRRKVIATMKSLGAPSRLVFQIFFIQVAIMAALGVLIGLMLGQIVPLALHAFFADALPFPADVELSPWSLVTGAAYGFLVAAMFTLWPLGQAERVSPAELFRDEIADQHGWPSRRLVAATAAIALALAVFVVLSSDSQRIALWFVGGLTVIFAAFLALGHAVTWLARRLPRTRVPELALAVRNIGAPGGLTRSVVLSLGAGLSLLVAVGLTDASLLNEMTTRLPERSPNYFVLDVPKGDLGGVAGIVHKVSPEAKVESAPMLRGRLVRLGERPVERIKAPAEADWVLRGDRGLSYSETVPAGSEVVAGSWWPKDYSGEPLVSFEAELARQLGVAIGDTVTVNVLGRNVTARISNLRQVNWESLAINFVMVFSPNTLAGAPHNLLATLTLPEAAPLALEAEVARALGKAYPTVTVIRVKDAIQSFGAILDKIMVAVRVAGSVTLAAGALVLAGALATAQRRRILEAVILKALGATRRRILASHVLEYLLIAAATAGFAVGFGALAAWVALEQVMDVRFTFSWGAVALALGLASGLVLIFGGLGTWQVLRARPVPYLRAQ
ncbi:MAG: FtsX-like permease family protein [Hyphomicrobiaceae bacterium]|nr:FtsX-like permease family protein [Hyphomicrobiaceae bacterium]